MWANFGHGWEEIYLALWRSESQIFLSTSSTVPFSGSYWNYRFMRDPRFSVADHKFQSLCGRSPHCGHLFSTLTLHLQGACRWLQEKAKRENLTWTPLHTEKLAEQATSSSPLGLKRVFQADDGTCLLPSSSPYPHHICLPTPSVGREAASLEQTHERLSSVTVLVTRYCSLLDNWVNSLSSKSKTTRGQTTARFQSYGIS